MLAIVILLIQSIFGLGSLVVLIQGLVSLGALLWKFTIIFGVLAQRHEQPEPDRTSMVCVRKPVRLSEPASNRELLVIVYYQQESKFLSSCCSILINFKLKVS